MKKSPLRKYGKSKSSEDKREIQRLVREIVIKRDKGCILRFVRHCGGEIGEAVLQADHLITRSNSATYADTRLIVCVCRNCHGWKHWHKEEYDVLVRTILPQERVALWNRAEADRKPHKMDWALEITALKQELKQYENL